MIYLGPFSASVNTTTEPFHSVADGTGFDPRPLNWLPCEEPDYA